MPFIAEILPSAFSSTIRQPSMVLLMYEELIQVRLVAVLTYLLPSELWYIKGLGLTISCISPNFWWGIDIFLYSSGISCSTFIVQLYEGWQTVSGFVSSNLFCHFSVYVHSWTIICVMLTPGFVLYMTIIFLASSWKHCFSCPDYMICGCQLELREQAILWWLYDWSSFST